jgi:hypothetical protein
MTTWSATDHGTGLTIAGNTATCTATADTLGRATASHGAAKKYFEGTWIVDAFTGASIIIGFANATAALNAVLGSATNAFSTIGVRNGGIFFDGVASQGGGTFTVGDRIGFAFDEIAFKFWWRDVTTGGAWFPSGDPNLGTGGYTVTNDPNFNSTTFPGPYFPAFSCSNINDSLTAFFGADVIGPVPTGFSTIDPAATPLLMAQVLM